MVPSWHFKKYAPCDTYRNSTADAFFDSDTISNPGNALVRAGIQNSLDAHKIQPEKPNSTATTRPWPARRPDGTKQRANAAASLKALQSS